MHSSRLIPNLALAITVFTSFGHVWGFGPSQVIWWGIPMIVRGPSNPPAPPAVPAPVPLPPAPQACPASCVSTRTLPALTTTLPAITTTLPAVTTTLPAVTTTLPAITLPPVTTTTPGILPGAIAQGSADCVAGDPAMPTPLFNEYGDLACCVPISTRDSSGTLQQAC